MVQQPLLFSSLFLPPSFTETRNRSKHVQWFYEKESSPPFSLIVWGCDYTDICTPMEKRERESLIME